MCVNNSSTETMVSWSPPDDPNGIIESYTVMYMPVSSPAVAGEVSGVNGLSQTLSDLNPYTRYTIVVCALTDKGVGEGSEPLELLTEESGELKVEVRRHSTVYLL